MRWTARSSYIKKGDAPRWSPAPNTPFNVVIVLLLVVVLEAFGKKTFARKPKAERKAASDVVWFALCPFCSSPFSQRLENDDDEIKARG